MPDREKVIKGVEHCFHGQECCGDIECPYYIEHLSDCCCLEECQENLKADAIALLKEQDAEISKISSAYLDLVGKASKKPEIVRCKDCKNLGYTNSHWFCKWLNRCVDEDWFCADGRRREE